MKLGTIEHEGAPAAVVALSEDEAALLAAPYRDIDALIAASAADRDAAVQSAIASGPRVKVADIAWLPPVRRPGKVLCVALNNSANPDRIMRGPDTPAMFIKNSSSLIGSGRSIITKEKYGRVHPEPELVVVIGKGGADIPVEEAYDHVFGYTIINDLRRSALPSTTVRGVRSSCDTRLRNSSLSAFTWASESAVRLATS